MYAIVEILGEQVKAVPGEEVIVPFMDGKDEGENLTFDRVMLISGDGEPIIGQPVIEGATVKAKVVEHFKDDKVIVFKKKRRTGYHKKQGHRQNLTRLMVEEIFTG
ncbi:50S ribosomal protein L21 [bacterium]|nr:MAG: 50S ribosomal protein L21 [bacterium]